MCFCLPPHTHTYICALPLPPTHPPPIAFPTSWRVITCIKKISVGVHASGKHILYILVVALLKKYPEMQSGREVWDSLGGMGGAAFSLPNLHLAGALLSASQWAYVRIILECGGWWKHDGWWNRFNVYICMCVFVYLCVFLFCQR